MHHHGSVVLANCDQVALHGLPFGVDCFADVGAPGIPKRVEMRTTFGATGVILYSGSRSVSQVISTKSRTYFSANFNSPPGCYVTAG
jgi:hypothetical protein